MVEELKVGDDEQKAYSEFDETYFKTLLENNSLYFDQQLKKFLNQKIFGILKKPIEYSILGQGKD